jgi:hypothetical protein
MVIKQDEFLRIAYVVCSGASPISGVYKKIQAQCKAWSQLGHEVKLVVLSDAQGVEGWKNIDCEIIEVVHQNRIDWLWNRFRAMKIAVQSNPDIVYARDIFPLYYSKAQMPIVIEVQSLTSNELWLRSPAKACMYKLLKRIFYRNASAAIFVTPELREKNEIGLRNLAQAFDLGTGIDFDTIRPLGDPISNNRLGVFFIGTGNQAWQGIAEIVELASLNRDYDFHVVGGPSQRSIAPNVIFHGDLTQDEYWPIASRCVVALGTLNQAVTKMRQAVPLKVREYLALGLPIVARYEDPYLDPEAPYVLNLPSDGKDLSKCNVEFRKFVESWQDRRVSRKDLEHLSFYAVEKNRVKIFRQILSEHNR